MTDIEDDDYNWTFFGKDNFLDRKISITDSQGNTFVFNPNGQEDG